MSPEKINDNSDCSKIVTRFTSIYLSRQERDFIEFAMFLLDQHKITTCLKSLAFSKLEELLSCSLKDFSPTKKLEILARFNRSK